jgi:hypothetical protein
MPVNLPRPLGDPKIKCIHCRWYHVGFEGNTCQKTRQVQADTPACIEYQAYRESPIAIIVRDKYLRDLEKSLQGFTSEYLKQVKVELKTYRLFKDRAKTSRDYLSQETMMEMAHQFEVLQGYIERVAEIKHDLIDTFVELQKAAKDAQSYLFTNYTETLRGLKNEAERGAYFRAGAPTLSKALESTEAVISMATEVYQCLKDAHFNMTRTQELALQLWASQGMSIANNRRSQI